MNATPKLPALWGGLQRVHPFSHMWWFAIRSMTRLVHDFLGRCQLVWMTWVGLLFFLPGDGKIMIMYTHVDDAATGLTLATQALLADSSPAVGETLTVGPEEALSFADWIDVISAETNRAGPLFSLPIGLVRVVTMLLAPLLNIGKARIGMFDASTIDRL